MVIHLPHGGIVSHVKPYQKRHKADCIQFFFFAAINIISFLLTLFFLPETKGVSLESMDILFGLTTQEQRDADIQTRARALASTEKNEKADVEHDEVEDTRR